MEARRATARMMLKVNAGYMDGFTEVILGERVLERMVVVVVVVEGGVKREGVQTSGEYLYRVNMIGAPLDTLGACVTSAINNRAVLLGTLG